MLGNTQRLFVAAAHKSCFKCCLPTSRKHVVLISACRTVQQSRLYAGKTSSGLVDKIYNEKETSKIIDTLNDSSLSQLKSNRITAKVIANIVDNRPFENLSQVVQMPAMDIVKFERLCKVLLKGGTSNSNKQVAKDCQPRPDIDAIKQMKTITSISLNFNISRFVQMSTERQFVCANHRNMNFRRNSSIGRYDHIAYVTEVKEFIRNLPESDVYLMENRNPTRQLTSKIATVNHARQLLDATFCALMAAQTDKSKVYLLGPAFIDKMFKLNIGSERVSSTVVVDQILSTEEWGGDKIAGLDMFRLYLHQWKAREKEVSQLCFIQCLAFIKAIRTIEEQE